ncbi:hypothetical protein DYB37_007407 [Aphanomyces astaci]|uniref:Protein kinase domain-containing protein n=1 Tax=Aphanomyces astaci TaxID=112090 RepID=A0A397C5V0_APHAT|nr:hypothetical protein DYB38_008442 [Aphanomyces astaci]RHZ16284.1 hypothetical protein DYB37_007407 [Aphanomyces astaci]RLO04068.1 hypothetical protein DYB28_006260 [Aphanomyces astaci]RQM23482.1 hypothetical protein B5M09_004663 [Aphanomyces astaci]
MWSLGCVFAELVLLEPLFPGESGVDQLLNIIKVVGTPSRADLEAMNPKHTDFRLPRVHPRLPSVFPPDTCPPLALDLLQRMLTYSPASQVDVATRECIVPPHARNTWNWCRWPERS